MRKYKLTNAQWKQIKPFISPPKKRGRPPVDDRKTLEAILYVLTAGCRWSDLPRSLGNHVTAWRRLRKWTQDGTFAFIWTHLLSDLDRYGKLDLSRYAIADSHLRPKAG